MKLKTKLMVVLGVSALLNILCCVIGALPSRDVAQPVFTMLTLILLLTPAVTCILAGILAGSNVRKAFWLILIPAVMNAAVWMWSGNSAGIAAAILIPIILGVLPGAIAMAVSSRIARKKNA